MKNKRGLELVTGRSSGYKQVQKNPFISDVLPDKVWWCDINWFLIPKITSFDLYKPIHDVMNYSIFVCPFETEKCGKEGKKLQKFEYPKNKNSSLDEVKNIFHHFWRASLGKRLAIF